MEKDNGNGAVKQLILRFLQKNYDYIWLKTMLEKASAVSSGGATLITGSSLALNGIQESLWNNAINCSMHSQDLYYDFLCAKRAVLSAESHSFEKCFIVIGYYNAYSDLSRETVYRQHWIPRVYYPIFQDAHNWETPAPYDLWSDFGTVPDEIRSVCERTASQVVLQYGTYYNEFRTRGSIFDLHGKMWWEISEEERVSLGIMRANGHNKGFRRYAESEQENKKILSDYVRFLHTNGILPVVVVTPFTYVYKQYMRNEIRENLVNMLDNLPDDVHYVDFNQGNFFEPNDFMDTDHLNAKGASKMSGMLVEMFGK